MRNNAPATGILETTTLRLHNLHPGGIIAFRQLPIGTPANHSTVRRAMATLEALVQLDEALGLALQKMPPLMPLELRAAVREQHSTAELRAAAFSKVIDNEVSEADALELTLTDPAPATTVAAIMADDVLRRHFNESAHKDKLWESMAEGGEPDLLEALTRLKVNADPDAARARNIFEALERRAHPEKVSELQVMDERHGWACGILAQVRETLDAAANAIGPSILIAA